MSWFDQHRIEWVAEMLDIYGFINREHIQRKFRISTPQASKDIQRFMKLYPLKCKYNSSTKRYERISDGGSQMPEENPFADRSRVECGESE